jgi:hypothetical protein
MKMRDIVGQNRSGGLRVPEMTLEQMQASEEFEPSSPGDSSGVALVRVAYAKSGEPAATMPPPLGVKQLAKSALGALTGNPNVLLDKLGERLAYERSGVRLYEALLSKLDAYGSFRGGPSRADLQHILDEELEHFHLLAQTIERLGGDPTAVTPSANVQATATMGIAAVLVDPRMSFLQSLEVMLTVELADNDCWAALIELAGAAGDAEAAESFDEALQHEREHLARVRAWVAAGQGRASDGSAGAEQAQVRPGGARRKTARAGTSQRGKAGRGESAGTSARAKPKRAAGGRAKASPSRKKAAGGSRGKSRSRRSTR